jgi:hypothetical protein
MFKLLPLSLLMVIQVLSLHDLFIVYRLIYIARPLLKAHTLVLRQLLLPELAKVARSLLLYKHKQR